MKFTDEDGVSSREIFRKCQWHRSGVEVHTVKGEVIISFPGHAPDNLGDQLQEDQAKFNYLQFRFRNRFTFGKRQIRVVEKDGQPEAELCGGPNYEVNRHWQSRIRRYKVRW
jgi:hypothetical protein